MAVFHTEVALRWGDMDALGHVNNAATLTLLEEGRVRLLAEARQALRPDFGLVVGRHEIDYLRPLYYAIEPVAMDVWVDRIGTASFTFGCEIRDASGEVAVRAQTVVVCIVRDGSGSMPLPQAARDALARYLI